MEKRQRIEEEKPLDLGIMTGQATAMRKAG